jgi:hypothetical protein
MMAEESRHRSAADAAEAAADLVTHDIDTDDLFALITEAESEPQSGAAQQPTRPAIGQQGQQRRGRTGERARDAR